MRQFTCDECGADSMSTHPAARFCSDPCRYRWKCRNRDARRSIGFGVCHCGTAFGGAYGETKCKSHRGRRLMANHGPTLISWPEFGPMFAPDLLRCASCGVGFYGLHRRFCSERCFRSPVNDANPASTDIDVGSCRRCGDCYAHRANTVAAGFCSALCNKRSKRAARKRMRRSPASEPYTLREIADRDGWCCHLCGKKVPDRQYAARDTDPTIDHLVPVSAGGDDIRSNVALAHNRCNWERGAGGLAQLRLVG